MNLNFKTLVGALAVLSLASCSKNDVFDAQQAAANEIAQKKTTFENNFVAKYGQVAPTQSWDFSTNQQRLGTRAGETAIVTKTVEGLNFDVKYKVYREWIQDSWTTGHYNNYLDNRSINKNKNLLNNVSNKLKDGDHHYDVQKAVLVAPSNSFTIYPISAQGSWTHDLYVKVGNAAAVKVYSKTWTDYSHPYVNGDPLTYSNANYYEQTYKVETSVSMPGLYVEAPIGTPIEIYLDNVKEGEQPTVGTSTGHAIYVDGNGAVPTGIEVRDDAVIKYVGIEDNTTKSSDLDYNDVVLAIVGNPDVPKEIIIENDKYDVTTSLTKRYMMEDLGDVDDFDFNDVVVDVTETTVAHHTVEIVNGVKTSDNVVEEKSQKAVVRHLGGILPFQLTIGNTTFELGGKESFDTDVEIEEDVTGWIPAQNNVSVKVKESESKMYTNAFPKDGEFPMMFACDPEVKWAAERQKFDFEKEFGVSFTKKQ